MKNIKKKKIVQRNHFILHDRKLLKLKKKEKEKGKVETSTKQSRYTYANIIVKKVVLYFFI